MRGFGRGLATLACIAVPACAFDSDGQGSSGSATIATTAPGTESGAASSESSTGEPEVTGTDDTVDPCPPGNIGCACDMGTCHDVLSCIDDVCLSPTCPNGVEEAFEECDDDNAVDDDGCDADCTLSRAVARLALGDEHTCVLFHTGEVRCWGNGGRGRTGHQNTTTIGAAEPASAAPTLDLGGLAADLSLGVDTSCALLQDGTLRCWGARERIGGGPLVLEDIGDTEAPGFAGPVDIGGLAVDVAVGPEHACAVRVDGKVVCWGAGGSGRLGYGNTNPIGVTETPATAGGVDLGANAATAVAVGIAHSCALLENQNVRCWGESDHGILGDPMLTQDLGDDAGETPGAMGIDVALGGPAIAIDAGNQHTCALLANSTIRCWGFGNGGRLGLGTNDDIGDNETPAMLGVDIGGTAAELAVGRAHTCVIRQDGALLCWGIGDNGRLGSGNNDNLGDMPMELPGMLLPVVVHDEPTTRIVDVDGGGDHTCARLTGGRVRCWGKASSGQLGYGNTQDVGGMALSIVDAGDVVVGAP